MQLDDDDWLIAAAKLKKNGLKSGVNSRLKSDPIIDTDFRETKAKNVFSLC